MKDFKLIAIGLATAALTAGCASRPKALAAVKVSETVLFGDLDCLVIETPSATYALGKRGAGFASILDPAGRDWISYSPGGQARGEYRGLPKCGQPVKYFHCGYGYGQYANTNWFETRVTAQEPDHVRIHAETANHDSACDWDFLPDHATLTLLKIGQPNYWFLYEGTPGGELDVEHDYAIRPGGKRTPLREPWSEVAPWVVIGSGKSPYGLVCVNHQRNSPEDSYVSWPYKPEPDGGLNQMTVFGFGRHNWQSPDQHHPALAGLPARFTIALVPTNHAPVFAQQLSQSPAKP